MEVAYDRREISHYDALLDQNFTFFFAPGDVGGSIPVQWGRAEDLAATTRLFDKNLSDPNIPRCLSINLDLADLDSLVWVQVVPQSAPSEVWYTTTVFYAFTFQMEGNTNYIANPGSGVQFTVRDVGANGKHHWQLVELHDLGGPVRLQLETAAVEPTTLGLVKALYRQPLSAAMSTGMTPRASVRREGGRHECTADRPG